MLEEHSIYSTSESEIDGRVEITETMVGDLEGLWTFIVE